MSEVWVKRKLTDKAHRRTLVPLKTETTEVCVTDSRVEEAIAAALEWGEVGLQVAAYLDGELIVDAWLARAPKRLARQYLAEHPES